MRLGVEAALVDGRLLPGDVALDHGVVSAVGLEPGGSGIAAPGLVDLQVNGFAGVPPSDRTRTGSPRPGSTARDVSARVPADS